MRTVIILCLLLLCAATSFAATDKRVALVIGNSSYANSPLKNPVNDAKDMATKLRGLGFEVIERNNLTTKQIGGTLREFRSKLSPGAVALVFYAGHGLQIKGDNYLPAVDADINSEEDVPNQSIAMKQIMDVLDESKSRLNLVFLDACRNNPYARSFRSSDRGLARVSAPSGTLISYATKPGSVAADGNGRNGLYTSKLLAQMNSNQQIEQSLKRVVTEVKTASNGKQEPWMEGSIEGDFCFAGCSSADRQSVSIPSQLPVSDSETEAWNIVKHATNIEIVRDFLSEFPKGKYASPARMKLKELEHKAQVAIRQQGIVPDKNNQKMPDVKQSQYFQILTLQDSTKYEGEIINNMRNGQGTLTSPSGEKYIGAWVNDKRNGQGTLTLPNGYRFEGEFRDDKRNGQGAHTFPSGERYEGEFRDDKQNGKGTHTLPSGYRYEGEFRDDKYNGQGTLTLTSGEKYIGAWVNGKRNGRGTNIFPNGRVLDGLWENDLFKP